MIAHAEMIALGLDVGVDHLVVEELVRARLARESAGSMQTVQEGDEWQRQ